MSWVAVSGSWRRSNPIIEQDVREAVASVMNRGDGIITGGALGVDYIATKEALKHNPEADRITIIIPTPLEVYAAHYRNRANEGVITFEQAESLIGLLNSVRLLRTKSLLEMGHMVLNEVSYYDRNTEVLQRADELLAFQVDDSQGVQDAIDKAREADMTVIVKRYKIKGSTQV